MIQSLGRLKRSRHPGVEKRSKKENGKTRGKEDTTPRETKKRRLAPILQRLRLVLTPRQLALESTNWLLHLNLPSSSILQDEEDLPPS